MNEVSLLFYGQPEKLNSALLLNLNIIEFRKETQDHCGLYILENKFGKEVLRKVTLSFEEGEDDWLIYRYLSSDESAKLKKNGSERRVYVLLQNYMTLEYFQDHITDNDASVFYLVGQNEGMKSMAAAGSRFSSRNILFVKSIRKKAQQESREISAAIPDFMATMIKLLLNPVDEFARISRNLMHSNRRVLYRMFELFNFAHFIIFMTATFLFRVLGVQLFWKSVATIGFLRVAAIKTKFFLRHIFLMEFYKAWGVVVDAINFSIRVKDQIIRVVYYNGVHKIYFSIIHKAVHHIWLTFISPTYYKTIRPVLVTAVLKLEKSIYYKGIHRLYFASLSAFGAFWEKVLSPLYFKTVHRFVHTVLKPVYNFIYYGIIHWFFYRILHAFYHRILKPIVSFIFYRSFHALYHRLLKPAISFTYYRFVHALYHRGLLPAFTFIWYKIFHRVYYGVLVFVVYRVWPWVKFNIFIRTNHFLIYKVRHYFLMVLYKSYGLGFDMVMLAMRVTKLYLLYPFFKVYWFTSFQYNKRIKKFFA